MDYTHIWIDEADTLAGFTAGYAWPAPHITPPPMAIAECLMHLYPPVAPSQPIRFPALDGTAAAVYGGRRSGKTFTTARGTIITVRGAR